MNAFTLNRIIGVALILVMLPILWGVYSLKNRNLVEEAELAMQETLARWITPEMKDLAKEQAETRLLEEKQKQSSIIFWGSFFRYGAVGSSSILLICLFVLSLGGYIKLSTHTLKIGEHEIQYRGHLSPEIASGLMVAEQIKQTMPEQAVKLYLDMAKTNSTQLQALSKGFALPASEMLALPEISSSRNATAPTFGELLHNGMIAPGKPLVMGFHEGEPQLRDYKEIKSCAVAGWQGSGKTLSMAYTITSILFQYKTSRAYVIDPHHAHDESLAALIRPLEASGRLKIVNPVDTIATIRMFSDTMKKRIAGVEPSDPPLFLVIDEMNKLCRSLQDKEFDDFMEFLAEATEETRKANITFFGVAHKWSARYFKNRKDIRDSMPSLMVHKSKPSQADLLIEDTQERKLVKQLSQPGECLLATSHSTDPQIVRMPLITRQDIDHVVEMITVKQIGGHDIVIPLETSQDDARRNELQVDTQGTGGILIDSTVDTTTSREGGSVDMVDTLSVLREKLAENVIMQKSIVESTGIEKTLLSKVISGKRDMSNDVNKLLTDYVCQQGWQPIQKNNVVKFRRGR